VAQRSHLSSKLSHVAHLSTWQSGFKHVLSTRDLPSSHSWHVYLSPGQYEQKFVTHVSSALQVSVTESN
jgi:hypothetical protein